MKIYVLYTGGTIGCVGEPLSPMSGRRFSKAFNELVTPTILSEMPDADVTIGYFDHTLDSTNMQPSEWVLMAQRIVEVYNDYDDFLVLHGTDTMAWTASALSFLLPGISKTVTVTGSQLPLFNESSHGKFRNDLEVLFNTDAIRNVLGAVRFFTSEVSEVCLYFADKLFRGNRTVKSNSSKFTAFSSPNYHALGEYGALPVIYDDYVLPVPDSKSMSLQANLTAVSESLSTISKNISNKSVLQIQTFPGYYSEDGSSSLLASMMKNLENVQPGLAGVIFESYGIGNIPSFSSMQDQIQSMHEKGIILVDCTQVFAGKVDYNEYATGAWLKDCGVISGQDMTPIASMAKLTVLLAKNPPQSAEDVFNIEQEMGTDLAGELESYYSLSSYKGEFLMPGDSLFSINGLFQLENRQDGYITVYDVSKDDAEELWSKGCGNPGRLKMQGDNNLVYYDIKRNANWESDTASLGLSTYLLLGNDGSLKLFNADTDALYATMYPGPGGNKIPKRKRRRGARRAKRRTAKV